MARKPTPGVVGALIRRTAAGKRALGVGREPIIDKACLEHTG